MTENKQAERVPRYCPRCQTEWQPNATCCSGCGVKKALRGPTNNDVYSQKVSRAKKQSGANEEQDIEYIEEITVHGRFTVRTYRPILTAAERKKREQAVIDTLTSIARRGGSFIKEEAEQ